jgi:hypothetical protein
MKFKILCITLAISLIVVGCWAFANTPMPSKRPSVEIPQLYAAIMPEPRISGHINGSVILFFDENGNPIIGPPPGSRPPSFELGLHAFEDATLRVDEAGSIIELEFGDNYLSPSFSVRRWNTKYHGFDMRGAWSGSRDPSESVEMTGNTIHVINDGYDYIYEVVTIWEGERFRAGAVHVFRTISGDEPLVY